MKNKILTIISGFFLLTNIAIAQSAKIFIKGTNLVAETLVSGYSDDYIEIENVSYSTSNDKLIVTVPHLNKPNGRARTEVLTFTKSKSKSSQIFHYKLITGSFDDLEIAFAKFIPGDGYQTYMNYKMKQVFVLSIKDNNDFTETIELLVPKLYMYYKPTLQPSGQLGTEIPYGWDFKGNVSWNGN
ncbi:MAG: type VI secretion system tube protein Hcp [Bacteroidetes bacterium]|nr:type VI secretion system tube protein Hcp [Bacteroidota bacterium]